MSPRRRGYPKRLCRRVRGPQGIVILDGNHLADPVLGWQPPLNGACAPPLHLWPPVIRPGTTCLCGGEHAVLRYAYPRSQRGAYLVCEPV